MTSEDISRTIARLTYEIIEKNPDLSEVVIVGLVARGDILAHRIAAKIKEIAGADVPIGKLDITFYRDDINRKGPSLKAEKTEIPVTITDKTVVLVDDVLYTGRTIRAAIDALIDHGRPGKIQLAALLDRGHRELPIRPDYVGKNIPTAYNDRVQLKLKELDGEDIVLLSGPEANLEANLEDSSEGE
ncbi:MAG: bifunctional pyr operon transcriptional regulator/uracil phosphoribosyltransferase PyrR [Nitrospinota bacterium]